MKTNYTFIKLGLAVLLMIGIQVATMAWGTDVVMSVKTNFSKNIFSNRHVAVAENGWIYTSCYNSDKDSIYLYKSTNGGVTFSELSRVDLAGVDFKYLDLTVGMKTPTVPVVMFAMSYIRYFPSLFSYANLVEVKTYEDNGTSVVEGGSVVLQRQSTSSGNNYYKSVSIATDTKGVPTGISPFSIAVAAVATNGNDTVELRLSTNAGSSWLPKKIVNQTIHVFDHIDLCFIPTDAGLSASAGNLALCYVKHDGPSTTGGAIVFDTYSYDYSGVSNHFSDTLNKGNSTYLYSNHPKISATSYYKSGSNAYTSIAIVYDYEAATNDVAVSYVKNINMTAIATTAWSTADVAKSSTKEIYPDVRIRQVVQGGFPNPVLNVVYQADKNVYESTTALSAINFSSNLINDVPAVSDTVDMRIAIEYDPTHINRSCVVWSEVEQFSVGMLSQNKAFFMFDASANVNTGIEDPTLTNTALSIYPNPANAQFTIATDADMVGGKITISNLTGSVVFEKEITNEKESFSVTDFAKGMYLVNVVSATQQATKKLIVE